jgi:hypothetical protein
MWKPISTAPKNIDFLALTKHGHACVMIWHEEADEPVRAVTCRKCSGFGLGNLMYWTEIPSFANVSGIKVGEDELLR